jgi:hypothetical protein
MNRRAIGVIPQKFYEKIDKKDIQIIIIRIID